MPTVPNDRAQIDVAEHLAAVSQNDERIAIEAQAERADLGRRQGEIAAKPGIDDRSDASFSA